MYAVLGRTHPTCIDTPCQLTSTDTQRLQQSSIGDALPLPPCRCRPAAAAAAARADQMSPGWCPYNFFRTSGDIINVWDRVVENLMSVTKFLTKQTEPGVPPIGRPV